MKEIFNPFVIVGSHVLLSGLMGKILSALVGLDVVRY